MIITSDPKNDVYKSLIDLAFDVCDEFILVVHKESGLICNDSGMLILQRLADSLKETTEQTKWAGTELYKDTVYVYHYSTDTQAREIIKEVSSSLYGWVHPDFPEDLCFYKNGKPWLINTAHERQSHILTEDKAEIDRILNIKGLEIRL